MTHLFLAVADRLDGLPQLKWVDADNGQLDYFEDKPSVAFPCALIDVKMPRCDDLGGNMQQCECVVRVRVAFDPTGEQTSNASAATGRRTASLAKYRLVDDVYATLQGFGTEAFAPLSRLSQTPALVNGYKVWDLEFATTFDDETAVQ